MQLWVVLWLTLIGLAVMIALGALEVEFDARALGEQNGSWAAAFGVVLLGVVVSGVFAKQQPTRIDLLILGKKIGLPRKRAKPHSPGESASAKPRKKLRMNALEAVELFFGETRHLELGRVDAELEYGFRDIALTGRLAGVLYALSGALPPEVHLSQNVRWDGAERWQVSASGRFRIWPGRVLFDVLWYMLRARRSPSAPSSSPTSSEVGRQSA